MPWRDGKITTDSFRFNGPDKLEYLDFIYSLVPQIQKICDKVYDFADVEWAIDADGKVWILQVRPITKNILLGQHNFSFSILSAGKASGKASVIPQVAYGEGWLERVKPYIDNFPMGGIMATEWTDTYFLPAMSKAVAIIVRTGSLMSHSAIISREKNIPCVLVGEKIWNEIVDGADVEIDTYAQVIKINGKAFGTNEYGVKDLLSDLYLFENVYGITGAQSGKAWELIRNEFSEAGYRIHFRILNTADYGVPQFRERMIIVGVKKGIYRFQKSDEARRFGCPEMQNQRF